MLNSFEKNIIALVKSSLDGTAPSISEGLDLEVVYDFSQKMQITPLLYYGIEKIPGVFDTMAGKKFLKSFVTYSFICQNQKAEFDRILSAFNEKKIDHMPLKGAVIRDLYPHMEMRLMSDADILVRSEQYERQKKIMLENGYKEIVESDHEYVWEKKNTHIELHKRLIPSYNKDYYAYFGDGWKLACLENGSESKYRMQKEDELIYIFVHYAKHYRDAGIGIKHITDFYMYLKKYTDINWKYVECELKKLKLLEFWKNTRSLVDVWFYDKECDEITAHMTHKIFSGGAYGTYEAHVLSEGVKISKKTKNVRRKALLRSIFPSFQDMKQEYKFLSRVSVLYPLTWVFRWISVIFNPKKILRKKRNLEALSAKNIKNYQDELNYVGLDYNFK